MAGLEDIKSLTVRPPDLTRTTDRIPWTSIAGALGFASRPASLYGRAKYALEPHYHKEILFELFNCCIVRPVISSVEGPKTLSAKPGVV